MKFLMYLELGREVIFDEPKLHRPLGVFKDTEYHNFEEAFIPKRKLRKRKKVALHLIKNLFSLFFFSSLSFFASERLRGRTYKWPEATEKILMVSPCLAPFSWDHKVIQSNFTIADNNFE